LFHADIVPSVRRPKIVSHQGKADMGHAYVLMCGEPFKADGGSITDCKVGPQFCVFAKGGGMVLAAGAGNLVKVGGIPKYDKFCKVRIQIDWAKKQILAQTDMSDKNKGYEPAIQTAEFRDQDCDGIRAIYLYNMEVQALSWWRWIKVHQDANATVEISEGMNSRAYLVQMLKKRDYNNAVAADMAVGMKMGAISSTKEHGMNLAQEQQANNSAGAAR
jgi:hypothetical protein